MRTIVVGGGMVGSTLAAKLARDGHDVVLIEKNRHLTSNLSDRYDIQTIVGNGATMTVLMEAGIESAKLLVASTDSDEANMVVAFVGADVFQVPRVVARLRDPGHELSFRRIAKNTNSERLSVNPERAAVERIMNLMHIPGAADVLPFLDGKLFVAGFNISPESDFVGLLLSHLKLLFPAVPMLVVAIRRDHRWLIPHGDDEIKAGDLVYFAMDPSVISSVSTLLGIEQCTERRVMICGAGRIGLELAARLETAGRPVTLIDPDREACELAAERLDKTLVIHGLAVDRELLLEEGADKVETFIACADDHQINVVACLLARRLGAAHTFALVDNPALAGLIGEVGIDAVISPRLLAVSLALQFARRGRVTSVAALVEEEVEVLEAVAEEGSKLVCAPLAEVGLPKGVLVAAITRNGEVVVPQGSMQIEAGDRVVLITTIKQAPKLDDFLG